MATYATNRKAHFDFEHLDTFEAGVVLLGTEVKSVRSGRARLDGAYVVIRGGTALLIGASIPAFQPINTDTNYDPERARELLLGKKELARLTRETEEKGLTTVAISLYNSGRHIKLRFALARGKKKVDKRETIKARDTKREIERTLKRQI